jgi:hypothetical protein
MLSTPVFDAPAAIGGSGSVRACTGMPGVTVAQRRPWVLGVPTAAVVRDLRPARTPAGAHVAGAQPFGTTNPYSTLGNHSPGRPQS